ncbi:retropepsin-like aspartic protease [Brevundimonas goettingensis]|uniref:Retropepsin-like domain-containing protein n=1 Tax=Brevundimonas goettingensis TaxID=2774190 RepID=A0A975C246_9CAUL|nr:retropepsin-like aspartic protease [Brevundimonas goettingensis]QTC91457.1 retropepsin-like domain-containing protein [Brevundimonas goettingensis]
MNRRDLLIRLGAVGATVGAAWWFRDHVLWRRPDIVLPPEPEWLPFADDRANVPTVDDVRLNGRPVRALIDSGAQYSVIDRDWVKALGAVKTFDMPVLAYGVGGQAQIGKGVTLDVAVGGTRIDRLRTAILDLGQLASDDGLGTALILGQDVLGEIIVDLDPAHRRVRFLPREASPPTEVRPVNVHRAGKALRTTVVVEGTRVEAVIDTGSSSLLALSRSAAASAGLLDGRERRRGSSLVLGGSMESTLVEVRSLTFADQIYESAEIAIFGDVALPGFPDALIGMEAFVGRRVLLDLGGGRMWASRELDLTIGD